MESKKEKKKTRHITVLVCSALITFGVLFVISFIIPYTVNSWVIGSVGNSNSSLIGSWISFWGSFLGGIVGMAAVLLTTYLLIKNQNKHHLEQLMQQRDDVVNSINSSVKLEREKFMVQFNIDKYERALLLLLKLENNVDIYIQKYNEAEKFIMESIKFLINSPKIIPNTQYKIYLDTLNEVDDQIREILQELSTLDKIVNSFGFEVIDKSSIYQFLIVVSSNAKLLNSDAREQVILERRIDALLENTRSVIKKCEVKVHSCIEQELLKFKPIE